MQQLMFFLVITDHKSGKRSWAMERRSKKEGRKMKLPLTACSVAYHRGSESAKQVLIKCCQHWLYQAVCCDWIKKQGADPSCGMDLATAHKQNESLTSIYLFIYHCHKLALCIILVSNNTRLKKDGLKRFQNIPAQWQKMPEATPTIPEWHYVCREGIQ